LLIFSVALSSSSVNVSGSSAASATCRSRTLHPALVLALHTGLPRGELFALPWSQISFEQKVLTVGKSKTVAGGGRIVPLNGRAFETFEQCASLFPERKPNHAVFPRELVALPATIASCTSSSRARRWRSDR
jgi:integrase